MSQLAHAARDTWSSKWAFILAAAASAVGLGNLWRFPYLAAKYGGGMFLLTYLVLVFTFGLSLLLVEIALGRKTRQSTIGAFKLFGKKYAFIGILASLVPFIITPYYCVIGGWVAKYVGAYFFDPATMIGDGGTYFSSFITSSFESYIWLFIFMAIVFFVVSRGIKGGIEKANLIMMPALIIMTVILVAYTLCQPGALDGAAYYLVPDFSAFSIELVVAALGQMFFSLSIAMGIMVTYGSYMKQRDSLTSSAIRVAGFDIGVSFLAGLMIVPAAFVALGSPEAVTENSGPGLMFIVLPQMFASFGDFAPVIGVLFFLLVIFAALTSAISLMETCVSIMHDGAKCSRKKATVLTFVIIGVAAVFVNLGYNGLSFIEPLGAGTSLLDFFDFISNTIMMPIVAFLTCIFVGWCIKPKIIEEEIMASSPFRWRAAWRIMIKYIAPILIAIVFISFLAQFLGFMTI